MKERKIKSRDMALRPRAPLRLCFHWENGQTDIAKSCIRNYQCEGCAFDQWLDETDALQDVLAHAA